MLLEHLIGSWKKGGHVYQENNQKRMQQKKPIVATLLSKNLEENYSNYFSRALNASRLIFL